MGAAQMNDDSTVHESPDPERAGGNPAGADLAGAGSVGEGSGSVAIDIGVLGGTGPAGSALALRLASVGYRVVIGSRDAARARSVAAEACAPYPSLAGSLAGGDNHAAASATTVVIATPWDAAAVVAGQHRDQLDDKVVISMANALVRVGREFQPLVPPRGSVATRSTTC